MVSNYPAYTQKICAAFPQGVTVTFEGSNGNFWGWFSQPNTLGIYAKAFTNDSGIVDTVYIIAHEGAHALAFGNPSIYQDYLAWPGIDGEIPKCFYDYAYTGWSYDERFAEAIAFYAMSNFSKCSAWESQYPNHYDFVDQQIFK